MKGVEILVTMIAVIICLTAGCAGDFEAYADSGQVISASIDQGVINALGSNPSTG